MKFKGGVTLPEGKSLTQNQPIRELAPVDRLVVPLAQNAGIPPSPVVKSGDRVEEGQVIAQPAGEISAFLHAPAAGTIKSIGKFPHPVLGSAMALEIETDHTASPPRFFPPLGPLTDISGDSIRERVGEAGIVGLGGAAFPTAIKLKPDLPIEYAILNGAECEPYLTVDHRILVEQPARLIEGLRLIMRATAAKVGIIAVEENKRAASRELVALLKKCPEIRLEFLKVKYPQGSEKQLIYSLLGRAIPPGKLPADVGCVVQNLHTALAIAEAVFLGQPLISRVITVTGPGVSKPGNFKVRIGTLFSVLIEAAGGLKGDRLQVLSGGPMMGQSQPELDAPIIKGTSGIVVVPAPSNRRNLPCIRCGGCLHVCPMGILPCEAARAVGRGDNDEFFRQGGMNCIECGCCAYVCPSGRDLVQIMQLGKKHYREKGGD